jgi:hypothetical protein
MSAHSFALHHLLFDLDLSHMDNPRSRQHHVEQLQQRRIVWPLTLDHFLDRITKALDNFKIGFADDS